MKPWELFAAYPDDMPDDDLILSTWEGFHQSDFYFALQYDKLRFRTIVYLTPKEYYHQTGWMFEDSIPIIHLLPSYLEEVLEAIYETDHPRDRVLRDLCAKGFTWGSRFQDFIHLKMGIKDQVE